MYHKIRTQLDKGICVTNNNNKIYLFELLHWIAAGLLCIQQQKQQKSTKQHFFISSVQSCSSLLYLCKVYYYKFEFCNSQMKQVLYPVEKFMAQP